MRYDRSTDPLWPFVKLSLIFLLTFFILAVVTLILGLTYSKLWMLPFIVFSTPIVAFLIWSMYHRIMLTRETSTYNKKRDFL